MTTKKLMIYMLTAFMATSCITPKIAYATEGNENLEADIEFTAQDALNELDSMKENDGNENGFMSGDEWLQNSLLNNDFTVDISSFNLVEMPSNIDVFASDYQSKLGIMKEMGYGERSELEIKKHDGYTGSAMDLFQNKYGELFPDGLQLEKTEIPSDFNVSKMFEEASKARDDAYGKIMNSSGFQSVKNSIGISKLTNVPSYFKTYANTSISSLQQSLGISADLGEIAGFNDMKNTYKVDLTSQYQSKYYKNKNSAQSKFRNSYKAQEAYDDAKDTVKYQMDNKSGQLDPNGLHFKG